MMPFVRFQNSFQIRVFLSLALIITIFIPGTGYMSYFQARKAIEKQMRHYSINMSVQIAVQIRQFLSKHMENVRLTKAFLEKKIIDVHDKVAPIEYFYILKKNHPEFANVYFGSREGLFVMVPPQRPEIYKLYDPRTRPWYKGAIATGGEHWTNVYLFASSQNPGITASCPIYNDKREAIGVCGIDIDLSTFSRFLQNIKIDNQGYAYVIENKHGRVIAHPDLTQQATHAMHIDLLSTCLSDLKSTGKQFGSTIFREKEFFSAYTDYPEMGWSVGVTFPMNELLRYVQTIRKTIVSSVAAAMVLCFMLSYFLTITIVRPLKALQVGIERVSSGDLDFSVKPPKLDIAEALANSFNRMAQSLKDSQLALERTYIESMENEKMAALGHMTAGIAHELKNPLGVILGAAQVVANAKRPMEMREEAARFIIDETERLDKSLTAFLAFSKPALPVFSPTDVVELLEDTLSAMKPRMNNKNIEVIEETTSEKRYCQADSSQIRQVFLNILINASQAMPDGGKLRVNASYRSKEEQEAKTYSTLLHKVPAWELVITITDSGHGILPSQIDKIFEPFVSFRNDGVGLGLSIVHRIIKLHQSEIAIESMPDKGTTVLIKFPCDDEENEKKIKRTHH